LLEESAIVETFKHGNLAGTVAQLYSDNSSFCAKHRGISEDETDPIKALPPYLLTASQQLLEEVLKYLNKLLVAIKPEKEDEELEEEEPNEQEELEQDLHNRDSLILISWLEAFYKRGDAFRRLLADMWTKTENDQSLLDVVMRVHPTLPEDIVEQLHGLFFPLLFVSFFRKRFLKRHFIPYYRDRI
jgi:hypothetical protein